MNTNASADERENGTGAEASVDYEKMLDTLDVAIAEARRKVENGRVYDADNEKVRIKWIRALAYAVNVRRQVTNDRSLEELAAEIEELKQARGVDQ